MEFLNLALIFTLSPFCQGLVQMLKRDTWSTWVIRVFTVVIGIGLSFLVRQAGIPMISEALVNPFYAILVGIGTALVAAGLYGQQKNDIVNKIAQSTSDVTVPSEMLDVKKGDLAATKRGK